MRLILFVCTGNSCRSVMAKAICEQLLKTRHLHGSDPTVREPSRRMFVLSAGVAAAEGMSATFETRSVLRNNGMDISGHRAVRLTDEMIRQAEHIFVMETSHKEEIVKRVPEAESKVHFLRTFGLDTATTQDSSVLDPIGKPLEVYEVCFTTIKEAVERVVKYLEATCESR